MTNREKIYNIAKDCLGQTFATNGNLGCSETVNAIVKKALGYEVGGGASTQAMYEALKTSITFLKVDSPLEGDIILSPTGQGNYPHGHVGIVGLHGILANDSNTGLIAENYTLDSWNEYFHVQGGFPVLFYRAVGDDVSSTPPLVAPTMPIATPIISTPVSLPVDTSYSANPVSIPMGGIPVEDSRPIYKSATKVVFIFLTLTACIALFTGKLEAKDFMILAIAAYSYYFRNNNK